MRNQLEYLAVRCFEVALGSVSERTAFKMGILAGRVLHLLDSRHRRIAENNLRAAFPERSPKWIRDTVRGVYQHFGGTLAEVNRFRRCLRPETISDYFSFEGVENLRTAQRRGNGVIIVTGHIGNWEAAGIAIAGAVTPITTIARPLDNPLLDKHLIHTRQNTGQRIVPKRGALRAMMEVLRSGGTFIVVADQHAGSDGVVVDFFGRPASTISTIASLALRFDSAVVPGYCHRDAPFRHKVLFDKPILPDRNAPRQGEIHRLTASFTKRLEIYIRTCPDQWLWLHRRWRVRKKKREEKLAGSASS